MLDFVPSEDPAAGSTGEVDAALVLDGAHPHGYLLTTVATTPPDVAGWGVDTRLVPGVTLHLHPRTVVGHGRGATGTVVLLGHPVDVAAGITDSRRIASRLCGTWDLRGEDALVREAAELGGRWTLLAVPHHGPDRRSEPGATMLVVPDTHATQPVFTAIRDGRLALASTAALAAQALDLPVDDSAVQLLEELKSRRPRAVTYLPGRRTAYLGVDPLIPNCLLRVDLGDPATGAAPGVVQERFWPWRERVETTDLDAVWPVFRDRLVAHTELLAGLGRPAVSLTAGGDSRVTAALARRALRERDGFAFTYVNPRAARTSSGPAHDVVGASAVAAQLGFPHRVLRWRQPPKGGTFDVLHRRTFAPLLPSRGAAHAMWADLPADLVQLQSNCVETGTTFVRRRTAEPLSPLRLARMMMNATTGLEDLAEAMYCGYVEWAQTGTERLLGYDHHDTFYWEQRIGRWGWQKFVDGDLGHRILLPFNDRVLVETMLSLPYLQRESKVLLDRVFETVPQARLPQPPAQRPAPVVESLARSVAGHLPGRVSERVERAVERRQRSAELDRLTWARGYAVLPASAGGAAVRPHPSGGRPHPLGGRPHPSGVRPPASWPTTSLPGGRAVLHRHPGLGHAVAGEGDTWVLVLGEPAGVGEGLLDATEIATRLHGMLLGRSAGLPGTGPHATGPAAAQAAAAALTGSWLVVLQVPGRTVVVTDPLVSLGLHLLPGGHGMASHATLAPGSVPVRGDMVALSSGPLGAAALRATPFAGAVDLPALAAAAAAQGMTRASRLARHVELLRRRGPAWLGLDAGRASAELLELLASSPDATHAVTWWDRAAGGSAAQDLFVASARAQQAGLRHRVLGLREDFAVSGGRDEAARALAGTWGADKDLLPLGGLLDQALPRTVMLWLGSTPPPPRTLGTLSGPAAINGRPQVWDLVQGVRPVALPFSDRLLPLLR